MNNLSLKMAKRTYITVELSTFIIVTIVHFLAVVHTSSTGIRELAASGSIVHITWRARTTHIGSAGVLTLSESITSTIGRSRALIHVSTHLRNASENNKIHIRDKSETIKSLKRVI